MEAPSGHTTAKGKKTKENILKRKILESKTYNEAKQLCLDQKVSYIMASTAEKELLSSLRPSKP